MVAIFKLISEKGSSDRKKGFGLGSNIVNLSDRDLTQDERSLLDKGLNYIPAPTKIEKETIVESVQQLGRRIKLAMFFAHGTKFRRKKEFRNKSKWTPPDKRLHPKILEKIADMESEIKNLRFSKENPNLKKSEFRALRKLKNNIDIVIKPADKGSATVIMNKNDYIFEANRQLSNTKHYKKLRTPIYPRTARKINVILAKLLKDKRITQSEYEYLKPPLMPRERRLYLLPKIHKSTDKWTVPEKIPPGRPIISDCESESYRVSEFIDSFLAPLATKHPAYVRDTQHFLQIIKDTKIPKDSFLVTLDVDSLYTNIENEAGISAVKNAFKNNPDPKGCLNIKKRPNQDILDLLKLSLENNDFVFNGDWYVQTFGTAMGKKFAPNYANIFMAEWETGALAKCDKKPLLYLRYLDDIFLVWTHSENEFWQFFDTLNNHHDSIKLKATIEMDQIDFLDVTLFKGNRFSKTNILDTKVYFKPTDTHQLLHKSSFHPKHTFAGILKSQLLRFYRICNNQNDFEEACAKLFNALRLRNYSKRFLRGIKNKTIQEIIENEPKTRASDAGIGPCGGMRCKTCRFIPQSESIDKDGVKIPVKSKLNCNSSNVIYVIHCQNCQKRYVGETGQTVRDRFNAHKADVKHGITTNVSRHFDGVFCKFDSDCKLYPIEQVPLAESKDQNRINRLERENYWIRKLETYPPMGLNSGYDSDKDCPIPFVVPYSTMARNVGHKIKQIYTELQNIFPNSLKRKYIIAYCRNKNLKDFLCSSRIRD